MALYEYRCGTCDVRFEARRPMGKADEGVECPSGHREVRRLISIVAAVGSADPAGARARGDAEQMASGGGCCGGSCGCGA